MELITEKELRSKKDAGLYWRIAVEMHGVKKRCRKIGRHVKTIGFFKKEESKKPTDECISSIIQKGSDFANNYCRELKEANISVSPCAYRGLEKNGFSSIKENLFDSRTIELPIEI